ncbi:hypothetical protein D3C72_2221990 [compost metagenome]
MGHQEAGCLTQQVPACRGQFHRLVAAGKQLLADLLLQLLDLRRHCLYTPSYCVATAWLPLKNAME